jgi:hypothetical protein
VFSSGSRDQVFLIDLVFGKGSLISGLRCLELAILDTQVDFQDGKLSFDGHLVEAFFLGFIFIDDGDGLEDV